MGQDRFAADSVGHLLDDLKNELFIKSNTSSGMPKFGVNHAQRVRKLE